MRSWMVALVLLLVPLAGCVGDADDATLDSEPEGRLLEQLWSAEEAGDKEAGDKEAGDDVYLLQARTGPDTPIVAYRWTVPAHAVVEHWFSAYTSQTYTTVVLEVAPWVLEGDVSQWAFFAYHDGGSGLEPLGIYGDMAATSTVAIAGLGSSEDQDYQPELRPFRVELGLNRLAAGDDVYFVVGATTEAPSEVGFAFRVAPESEAPWDAPAPPDHRSILGDTPRDVVLPERTGNGEGLQLAYYAQVLYQAVTEVEMRAGPVQVTDHLPTGPVALPVQERSVRVEYPSDGGWGYGYGVYWPDNSAGRFDAAFDLHGTAGAEGGHYAMVDSFVGTPLVAGIPLWLAVGDGAGGSWSETRFQSASSNTFDVLFVLQLDLGSSLQELTGHPGRTEAFTMGTLDTPLTIRLDDGFLSLGEGTPQVRIFTP